MQILCTEPKGHSVPNSFLYMLLIFKTKEIFALQHCLLNYLLGSKHSVLVPHMSRALFQVAGSVKTLEFVNPIERAAAGFLFQLVNVVTFSLKLTCSCFLERGLTFSLQVVAYDGALGEHLSAQFLRCVLQRWLYLALVSSFSDNLACSTSGGAHLCVKTLLSTVLIRKTVPEVSVLLSGNWTDWCL